jgi:hypothetical protein
MKKHPVLVALGHNVRFKLEKRIKDNYSNRGNRGHGTDEHVRHGLER